MAAAGFVVPASVAGSAVPASAAGRRRGLQRQFPALLFLQVFKSIFIQKKVQSIDLLITVFH